MSHGIKHLKTRKAKDGSLLFYCQLGGRQIPLKVGTLEEAQREIEKYVGKEPSIPMFRACAELFRKEYLPSVAPSTRLGYERHIDSLIKAFIDPETETSFALEEIRPKHIREYLDTRSSKVAANREVSVFCVMWGWFRGRGFIDSPNPANEIRRHSEQPRGRYVTDEEYKAVWDKADDTLKDAMDLMLLTGQRPSDVLGMVRQDIRDGYLWVTQRKTKTKMGIEVSGELERVVNRILERPRPIPSMYLVCDEQGQRLNIVQLDKRYSRIRTSDWQLRDLRAKTASESPDLKSAQRLLGHRTETTTAGIYRRVIGNKVKPLR